MADEHLSGLRHSERVRLAGFGPFARLADPAAHVFGTSWHLPEDGRGAFVELHYLNPSRPSHYDSVATQRISPGINVVEPDSFLKYAAQHRANELFRPGQSALSFAEIRSVGKDWTRYLNDIRPTDVAFEGSIRPASELVFDDAVLGCFQTQALSIYWSGTEGSFDGGFSIENAPAAGGL